MKHYKIGLLLIMTFCSTVFWSQNTAAPEPQRGATAAADPLFDMLVFYPNTTAAGQTAYLYVDTKSRALSAFQMVVYNNAFQLSQTATINLMPLIVDNSFATPQIIGVPWTAAAGAVCRLEATFTADGTTFRSPYFDSVNRYEYLSDILPDITYATGWGSVGIDKNVNQGALNIAGQAYAKGFGIHAVGWLEANVAAGKYNRFAADVGKQQGMPYNIGFVLKKDGVQLAATGPVNNTVRTRWDFPMENTSKKIRVDVYDGQDGTGSDHGSIGAPRLYLTPPVKQPQTLNWKAEQREWRSAPFQITLDAAATSGLTPMYRIVKGGEYANIQNGNKLNVFNLPLKDSIMVEAYQPGDLAWQATDIKTCKFVIVKGRVVQKTERIELNGGENLEELIVYADGQSSGQVVVKNGIVQVNKLIYKYTFVPQEWSFITFPSAIDIAKASNLTALGYSLNGSQSGTGAYYIREFLTSQGENPNNAPSWSNINTSMVQPAKGYLMGINNYYGTEAREVTFTINNTAIDFANTLNFVNLTLDLSGVTPMSQTDVYIAPLNVAGNTLKVVVNYAPADRSSVPVNHEMALKHARVTYTPDRTGIRLTLPDQTPAKVAIYDAALKKLYKAVRYVSPMLIDVSDLKKGSYQMVIQYGNAIDVKTVEK